MSAEFWSVFWKERMVLQRAYRKFSSYLSTLMYIVFFGVFPAWFLAGNFVSSPLVLFYISLAPLVTGAGMATLAFAGERENHTLETLLAAPLSEKSILMGKIAAHSLYAWMYVPLCLAAGWLTASLLAGNWLTYDPGLLISGLWIGLLVACFSTSLGALASLRAGTIKEAGRKLQGIYLLFVLPYMVINFLSDSARGELIFRLNQFGTGWVVLIVSVVLLALNGAFLRRSLQQFNRLQMILD